VEPFYGRTEVLAAARSWLERARAGVGRLLLFTGEPGIGKSRLAEQVTLEAAKEGALVAWGRCWEAGGAPAYWPWIQVFRCLEMDEDPFAGASVELGLGGPETRFAAFERAVRELRARAERCPLVIVLDDLHAADPPSLLLLLLLARELSRSAILVIGAYREAELRLTPELRSLLANIAREAEVVPLTRLSPDDVARWMQDTLTLGDAVDAGELYRVTEGHPLFVVEALRLGRSAQAQAAWARGPDAVLDERLGRLSRETRAVLEVAAVLGRDFSLDEVAETAELVPDRVHEALGEALATDIVKLDRGVACYRFSHVLLRDRLYAELAPSLRAALHYRAGTTGLTRHGDAQAAVYHLLEGQSAGAPALIAEVALAAGEAALCRLAFEEAARLCRRALSLPMAHTLLTPLRGRLQLVTAEALIRLGEGTQGKALCREAAALAEQAASHDLLARAALVYGAELVSGFIDHEMVSLLRKALAALPDPGDSALRARLLARLAAALTPPADAADCPEVLQLIRVSTEMARRTGDQHALLYAMQFACTVGLLVPEHERLRLLEETLALARWLDQPLVVLHTLPAYITALLAIGARAQAEALLPEYAELSSGSALPVHRLRFMLVQALLCALAGDFAEADRLGAEARALAEPRTGNALTWLIHRFSLAQLRALPELLLVEGPTLLGYLELSPAAVPHAPWLMAGLGRTSEARALLARKDLTPSDRPSIRLWELLGIAEACVLLDDAELGERVYPLFEQSADRMFWNVAPGAMVGPSARALGDLALLIGRVPEALAHYERAIAFCRKLGAPPLVALCEQRRDAALGRSGAAEPRASDLSKHAEEPRALTPVEPALQLRREGELWAVTPRGGDTLRLKHVKGFVYLECLLAQPGRELHVVELAGLEHRTGDAGPLLDARAKAAYRARLEELGSLLSEAERFADGPRARRVQQEIDTIAEQLAGALGLGGRDRRAASDVERTRINVQRRLKDAIDRIAAVSPTLGRHLAASLKTGTTCVYQPI